MAKLTKEEFIAAVKELTVVELNDLVEALQKEFNVTASAPVAAAPAAGGGAAPVEEKTAFDVILTGHDAAQKINVIKAVREVTGLGLKEAKDAVEKGTEKLKEGVKKEEADEIKKKIEAAGGKVEIK
ncbi:MAG: 50S ribosomal protein L7/L12 [Spirochaetota bacterium]